MCEYTGRNALLLLIDDASPDPRIASLLDRTSSIPNVQVLRNEVNVGFTGTVNRGIEAAGDRDVVLLNSDARVTPGWLDGLIEAARSRPRVATVTPLSDNAGAFSAPDPERSNPLPAGVAEDVFARAIRRYSARIRPSLPTGNGFCMYVTRAAINEIGVLDASAFPRGYGEENDFCMRAQRHGWHHLLDDTGYVFHERSASFQSAKIELIKTGRAIVDARYPEYKPLLAAFRSPAMSAVHHRVRRAVASVQANRRGVLPRVLFVYSTQTGGTPQTNRDLMAGLNGAVEAWTLRCNASTLYLSRFEGGELQEVCSHNLAEAIEPLTHVSAEYDTVVRDWLRAHDFSLVHIRHLAWHSLNLPAVARDAGLSVVFSFHDFYTLCPTVKMIDGDGRYCGGTCTRPAVSCQPDLWRNQVFPILENGWVERWREMFSKALSFCDAFVTTSNSAKGTILRVFPEIADRFEVIPHGRDFAFVCSTFTPPRAAAPIRILVPGNVGPAKGSNVIQALLEQDMDRQLEFHVLGATSELASDSRLILHGKYHREDFAKRVGHIAPTVGAMLSVWDETWCHTLTELWSVGVPVIVFDYGTVASRVRNSGGGWVFDHDGDVATLYNDIIKAVRDPVGYSRRRDSVLAWQAGEGEVGDTAGMSLRYLAIYRRLFNCARAVNCARDRGPSVPRSPLQRAFRRLGSFAFMMIMSYWTRWTRMPPTL